MWKREPLGWQPWEFCPLAVQPLGVEAVWEAVTRVGCLLSWDAYHSGGKLGLEGLLVVDTFLVAFSQSVSFRNGPFE